MLALECPMAPGWRPLRAEQFGRLQVQLPVERLNTDSAAGQQRARNDGGCIVPCLVLRPGLFGAQGAALRPKSLILPHV